MTRLTGPAPHPLIARLKEGRALRNWHYPTAARMLQEHQERGISDRSVFCANEDGAWEFLGPEEHHQHAATLPDHITVGWRMGGAGGLAQQLADAGLRGTHAQAKQAYETAKVAAPMVAALLASAVADDVLEWDTGESVQQAARRLCMDAGWDSLQRPGTAKAAELYGWVVSAMPSLAQGRDVAGVAAHWLSARAKILARLDVEGIEFGAPPLSSREAAEHVSVAAGTWRAYAARKEVPHEEAAGGWHLATLDAWRLTASRRDKSWWGRL